MAKEPGAVTNESKDGKAAPLTEGAKVVKSDRADLSIRSINESVELVRRLSPVPASK